MLNTTYDCSSFFQKLKMARSINGVRSVRGSPVRPAPRFQAAVIEALQYTVESHLTKIFEDANLLARHAKRITIYKTDLMLVRRIRGEIE